MAELDSVDYGGTYGFRDSNLGVHFAELHLEANTPLFSGCSIEEIACRFQSLFEQEFSGDSRVEIERLEVRPLEIAPPPEDEE